MNDLQPFSSQRPDDDGMWEHMPSSRPWGRILSLFGILAALIFGGVYFLGSQHSSADTQFELNKNGLITSKTAAGLATLRDNPLVAITASPTSTAGLPNTNLPSSCTISRKQYPELGFEVGEPLGWTTELSNHIISSHPITEKISQSFVYPVHLKDGSSSSDAASGFVDTLNDVLVKSGGSLILQNGVLQGTIGGTAIRGELASKPIDADLVLYGGWSTAYDWDTLRPTILGIGTCYRPIPKTPARDLQVELTLHDDQRAQFHLTVPTGWNSTTANSRQFDVGSTTSSGRVTTIYMTDILGDQTLDGMIDFSLNSLGLKQSNFIFDTTHPSLIDDQGVTWDLHTKEFTALVDTTPMHGIITAAIHTIDDGYGYGSYSSLATIELAPEKDWAQMLPVLSAIKQSQRIVNDQPAKGLALPISVPSQTSILADSRFVESAATNLYPKLDPIL